MTHALVLCFRGVISKTPFETHALSEAAPSLDTWTLPRRGPFDPAIDAPWRAMQADDVMERDDWALGMQDKGEFAVEVRTKVPQFAGQVRGADPAAVIRPQAPYPVAPRRLTA